jgi:agmatine deiminase
MELQMSKTIHSIPKVDGFRMPGEFEPHDGCWMLWPERTDNWRLGAKPAQKVFCQVAEAIARFEPVTMGVSAEQFFNARNLLPPQIRVVEISSNDSWMRDCGPTFLVNDAGAVRGVDWDFNAWGGLEGGLYFPWDQDDLVPQKVLNIERLDRYKPDGFVLEGGSIHVDGEGTLITTEECLLNPNRNPHLTRQKIEAKLRDYLNVEKIIWLGAGTFNDETNGHVDNLCCFIRPGVLALTWTDDTQDPQYRISQDAYQRLCQMEDDRGRNFEIHKIEQPDPVVITSEESEGVDVMAGTIPRLEGDRMAASYINFYIANHGVIVPMFGVKQDQPAIEKLQKLFPDREVIGIPAREILLGGGNIHCITQQQPAGG